MFAHYKEYTVGPLLLQLPATHLIRLLAAVVNFIIPISQKKAIHLLSLW